MSKYVDGFVLIVPNDQNEVYKKMAEDSAQLWKKHGALEFFECRGDDMHPQLPGGQASMPFPIMAKAKPDETVWFSFIIFKSKQHRDEVNAKVNKEIEESGKFEGTPMPFETSRMAYGGFEVMVEE